MSTAAISTTTQCQFDTWNISQTLGSTILVNKYVELHWKTQRFVTTMSVCLSVYLSGYFCLSAVTIWKPHHRTSPIFADDRDLVFFYGGLAISYILPVMCMMSCFHITLWHVICIPKRRQNMISIRSQDFKNIFVQQQTESPSVNNKKIFIPDPVLLDI